MLLGIRLIVGAASVNTFRYAPELETFKGDPFNLDLQLVDVGQFPRAENFEPPGNRYMPTGSPVTVTVTFLNLDAAKQFTRGATQPFPQDPSIWRVPVLGTDPLMATQDLVVTLIEAGVQRTARVPAAILVDDGSGVC